MKRFTSELACVGAFMRYATIKSLSAIIQGAARTGGGGGGRNTLKVEVGRWRRPLIRLLAVNAYISFGKGTRSF